MLAWQPYAIFHWCITWFSTLWYFFVAFFICFQLTLFQFVWLNCWNFISANISFINLKWVQLWFARYTFFNGILCRKLLFSLVSVKLILGDFGLWPLRSCSQNIKPFVSLGNIGRCLQQHLGSPRRDFPALFIIIKAGISR